MINGFAPLIDFCDAALARRGIPAAKIPSPRSWAWTRGAVRVRFADAIRDLANCTELREVLAGLVPEYYLSREMLHTIRLADRGELVYPQGRIEWEHTLDERNEAVLDVRVNPIEL